jgi:hypothetical protein
MCFPAQEMMAAGLATATTMGILTNVEPTAGALEAAAEEVVVAVVAAAAVEAAPMAAAPSAVVAAST